MTRADERLRWPRWRWTARSLDLKIVAEGVEDGERSPRSPTSG